MMLDRATGTIRVTAAARAVVETRLRTGDLSPRLRERLEMVKGALLGHDLATIATWTGRSPRTIRRWLARFADGGVTALADAPRSGRPVQATAAYRQALEQAVETTPPTLGLPFDVWTSARLSAHLAEQTGVRITPGWVRALLARHRFVCGRPKHTLHHLQDPDAVAASVAELTAVGGKGSR